MTETKEQLEAKKKLYENKIKSIDEKIDKIKPNPIGFQYKNKL